MNKHWTLFKYLVIFGFVVYPLAFLWSTMTMWEGEKAGNYLMIGYTLLIAFSLILGLIRSSKTLFRMLSYVLIAFWLLGVFSFINQMLYDYFKIGFYS